LVLNKTKRNDLRHQEKNAGFISPAYALAKVKSLALLLLVRIFA